MSKEAKRLKDYRSKHPDYYKKGLEDAKKRYYRNKMLIMEVCGGSVCARCGITDIRVLELDHKKGGGSAEMRKFSGNTAMYVYYTKHLDEARQKLQVLCCNCNRIKQIENNENRPPKTLDRWIYRKYRTW